MSFSFTEGQLKWDIPQKEAFAIYAAIFKFEYLLRDRQFIIHTDHRNITFLNTSLLSSIRKWKIYISEFNYILDYVKGEVNIVADAMSRLVADLTPKETWPDGVVLATLVTNFQLPPDIHNMIAAVHNHTAGHHGVMRTLAKLQKYCDAKKIARWPMMREHVHHFVKICPCCQKMSMLKIPIAAHPFTASSYEPMERIMIDYIGPFPDGQYILVVIDCFTRWTELYLVAQATAELTAAKLLDYIGTFGAPLQIVSDRGSHFVNEVIRDLLALVGTRHCLNVAYSKEESTIVERQNREVNRHLRNMFFHSGVLNDYVKAIPLVKRILNSTPSTRTRVSPHQLLFGNAISLDRGIILPHAMQNSSDKPLSAHASKLLNLQQLLLKIAEESIRKADEEHYTSFPATRTEFPIGSYVLLNYPENPPTRLHPRKRGPFEVVKFHHNDYTLRDLVSHKELTVNITRLSPFEHDPRFTNPRQVANIDQEVFDIEAILAHRGNLKRKGTLEFRVRWAGYDPTSDTWEPWKNLRDTEQLHSYLRLKGLAQMIPQKFKS
jgi:hypothetical protein